MSKPTVDTQSERTEEASAPSPPSRRDLKGRPAPALSVWQFLRWVWRQLTSMRTALLLLLLLALAAIPGSLIPQTRVDSSAVQNWQAAHPSLTPLFNRLGMFGVYTSPWFSAIYLLLMVSLVGCFVPRTFHYLRAVRARPPMTPRNLNRLPAYETFSTDASVDEVLAAARASLRRRRYRVDVDLDAVRAEKGYLREACNLVFHVCLLIVLVGVAVGALLGYRGGVIVTEGEGFSNTLTQYDDFSSGALYDTTNLPPFSFKLQHFTARFQPNGQQQGAPTYFDAKGTYTPTPGASSRPFDIKVNSPLQVGGTQVFLVGQGYSPVVTVRDGKGHVVFSGAVPFLPEGPTYTSGGVVKAPEASPEQLGFQGFFLPTMGVDSTGAPQSVFPAPYNPALALFAYHGNLSMDTGVPQSVYALDKSHLKTFTGRNGKPLRILLRPGATYTLPGHMGSISFDGVRRFAKFQISSSPGAAIPLTGLILAVLGLIGSLFIRPRRRWVRARSEQGRTLVEVAGLDRVSGGDLGADLEDLRTDLQKG
ncbi:MAG: cytochrome c biogenesis protein ResB [Nocardioidaceae bacterium]